MLAFCRCYVIAFMAILFCAIFLLAACNKKSTENDIVGIDPPGPHMAVLDWSASWNPTNNKIAYRHGENDTTNTVYPSGVYVIYPDGGNKSRILLSKSIINVDWSPDGRWIVANDQHSLFKISYPDGAVDTLFQGGEYYNPCWSPGGDKIACVQRGGPTRGIYTLDPDGSDYRLLIQYGDYPAWYSADSILYLNFDYALPIGSICISDISGTYKRLVVEDTTYGIISFDNINAHFNLKRIAASAVIPGASFYLYTYDIDQNDLRRFLEYADFADFSPDGDSIIYTDIMIGHGNLNIMSWDSTGWRQLTEPVGPEGGGL